MKSSWSRDYFNWLLRNRRSFNFIVLAVTAISILLASRLELRTSFSELLPEHLPSVKALKAAGERLGGTSFLSLGVESPDFEANRKFIEAMAEKLKPLVGTSIRFFEYKYDDVLEYVQKYGLHYLSLENLRHLKADIQNEIDQGKDSAIGLGLDDEQPAKKELTSEELSKDLDPDFKAYLRYRDAYLSAKEGKIMVISIRPSGSSLGIDESQKLVNQIEGMIQDLNPKSYQPEMKVNLTGSVKTSIAEFQTIREDIMGTAILLVLLILGILFLFFWSLRLIGFLCVNLLFAVSWTFALTELHIGYLNTQTAFLGSLVVGTGINYGIIFIYRFLELRKSGKNLEEAISEAIGATCIGTLIASSSTAVAFLSLLLAQNKGLSQFGFIGCVGVLLCWIAAYSLLPLWLYQLEARFPSKVWHHPLGKFFSRGTVTTGNLITKHSWASAFLLLGLSMIGILEFVQFFQSPVEYNFDNLRNRVAAETGTEAVERRINEVYSTSRTPSVVLLDSLEQAEEFCPAIEKLKASLPEEENVIHSCMSIYSLLPKERPDKEKRLEEMREIISLLQEKSLRHSKHWEKLKGFQERLSTDLPGVKDLPFQLLRRFTEKNGKIGTVAFVNPNSDKPLNDGINLLNFTKSLARIELPKTNTVVSASGDSFILADLLRGLKKDGPLTSGVALGGVIILAILLAGGFMSGFLMCLCLLLGTWWLLCIQGALDIKFNFFNFIALPLTFGIGVDYPINVFVRCRQENYQNYGKILATSGAAVVLCSLTTIIGYYTLIGATNLALVSFAKLALIGEITCLVAALILLPVLLRAMGKFRG
jgi:predicted RND superfamily exporter protein